MNIIKRLNAEMEALEEYGDQFARQIARRSRDLAKLNKLAKLDSVGSWISIDTGLVRGSKIGVFSEETPELDDEQAVHLDDCCEEWFSSLSKADTIMCARVAFSIRGDI